MSMSKKDFIALADSLRKQRPSQQDIEMLTGEYQQWKRDVRAVADVCCDANPRFNFPRWMDYIDGKCGPSGGKVKADDATKQIAAMRAAANPDDQNDPWRA